MSTTQAECGMIGELKDQLEEIDRRLVEVYSMLELTRQHHADMESAFLQTELDALLDRRLEQTPQLA